MRRAALHAPSSDSMGRDWSAAVLAAVWGYRFRMLKRLSRATRVNAARVLVALYTLCVLMPVAGFAFGNSAAAVHCLTDPAPVVLQTQHSAHQHDVSAHQDHAAHGHDHSAMAMTDDTGTNADHNGMKGANAPACCGVMCVSALPASLFELTPRTMHLASIAASSDAGITGEAPELLYRPPIVLLSM